MKKIILFLIASFFLVQTSSAFTFLNIYIDNNGEATFVGETTDSISLPEGIAIQGSTIIGKTQAITSKQGEIWSASYSLAGAEMNIILPKGAVIKSISKGDISISNDQISIFVVGGTAITYILSANINEEPNENYLLFGIILTVILIILIVFLINYSKREKEHESFKEVKETAESSKNQGKKPDNLKSIAKLLNEREKIILNTLKKSGKIKQSRLRKLTEIPKASFSRHIQELEKKKIIRRSGEGKNKFVELV